MIGWLALGILILLFAGLAAGAWRSWRRQRVADIEAPWRDVATDLDHAFSTADAPHELDQLPLPLLARLDDKVISPELTGPSEGGIQRLFITSVDGRSATIGVADLARPVPTCSLHPKGSDSPAVGRGWDEVDPGLAHVRSRFVVRGEDSDAVGVFLGGGLGGWLAGSGTDWSIELADHHVLVAATDVPVEDLASVVELLDGIRAKLPWAVEGSGAKRSVNTSDVGGGPTGKRKRRRRKRKGGPGGEGDGGSDASTATGGSPETGDDDGRATPDGVDTDGE
jgi:hypothetical protein